MIRLPAWTSLTLVLSSFFLTSILACNPVDFGNGGTVCACNETNCDFIGKIERPPNGRYDVYISNLAGLRFNKIEGFFVDNILTSIDNSDHLSKKKRRKIYKKWKRLLALKRSGNEVVLKLNKIYQEIFGFGGAFTDSTGYNIKSLPKNMQDYIIESYFSEEGLEYNVGRIPIGGTDFSPYAYSYDDGPVDVGLKNFALKDLDYKYKIPFAHDAKNLSSDLKFFGSAWTAPKWMKSNNQYVGGTLKKNMYQPWANYYLKFVEAYKNNGIDIWGVTTGNEPSLALFPLVLFNLSTVGWTTEELGTWVSQNLGPTIRNSNYSDVKILALDDQRLFLPGMWKMLNGPTNARDYIDGIAVHWYLDEYIPASVLTSTHKRFPNKFILATEACEGSTLVKKGVRLGDWSRAESYAADIIEDLSNWVTGWVDWNMALNMTGGPTYINNVVDSPIIVDAANKIFYKNPMYYALGHFSKFLPRGSVRVDLTPHRNLSMVAFKRPDDGVAIVILNKNNYTVPLTISRPGDSSIIMDVTPQSITSVLY